MFATLWPVLAKLAFQLMVSALQRAGVLNGVEAGALRAEHNIVNIATHLKTYSAPSDYPTGPEQGQRQ